jgi:hypothetical protein
VAAVVEEVQAAARHVAPLMPAMQGSSSRGVAFPGPPVQAASVGLGELAPAPGR